MIRIFAALAFSSLLVNADPNSEIESLLEPIRKKHRLPALAGAVFNPSGMIAQGATGVRKKGEKTPVTRQDLWHIGSDTKAMTATLAGSFVAERKLGWDDLVSKHFPEFAEQIDPALLNVTFAQLLSHRAGLIPNLKWRKFEGNDLVSSRRAAAKELLTGAPASAVGEYSYSNAGYVVAGAILEKLGGKRWEELLTERIFEPLKITSAGFGGTGTIGKIDQPWGHRENGDAVEKNGPEADNAAVLGPAGTVHLSIEDWSKFLTDQLIGSKGNTLLPKEVYSRIQSSNPAGSNYGLGWSVVTRPWAGGKALNHSGSNTMNLAVCWLALPKDFGIMVTTNQAGKDATEAAEEAISELIDWHRRREK